MRELFILHSVFPYIRRKVKEKGKKEGGEGWEREREREIISFYFLFKKGKILTRKITGTFLLN